MRQLVEVAIPPDLLARLEALPERRAGQQPAQWTPAEDAALLAYWPTRRHADVAKTLGKCLNVCRARFEKLKEAPDELG